MSSTYLSHTKMPFSEERKQENIWLFLELQQWQASWTFSSYSLINNRRLREARARFWDPERTNECCQLSITSLIILKASPDKVDQRRTFATITMQLVLIVLCSPLLVLIYQHSRDSKRSSYFQPNSSCNFVLFFLSSTFTSFKNKIFLNQ